MLRKITKDYFKSLVVFGNLKSFSIKLNIKPEITKEHNYFAYVFRDREIGFHYLSGSDTLMIEKSNEQFIEYIILESNTVRDWKLVSIEFDKVPEDIMNLPLHYLLTRRNEIYFKYFKSNLSSLIPKGTYLFWNFFTNEFLEVYCFSKNRWDPKVSTSTYNFIETKLKVDRNILKIIIDELYDHEFEYLEKFNK